MTADTQSPAPAQAGDAERLAKMRDTVAAWNGPQSQNIMVFTGAEAAFLLRLLDARDAEIAAEARREERTCKANFRGGARCALPSGHAGSHQSATGDLVWP